VSNGIAVQAASGTTRDLQQVADAGPDDVAVRLMRR